MTPRRAPAWMVLLALGGCLPAATVYRELDATAELIARSEKLNGQECAPESLADAVTFAAFSREAFHRGDLRAGIDYAESAKLAATAAWRVTEPCGGQDADGDGIPDVVDACPDEAEDKDGDRDGDGCRDLDPYADDDRDGIRNIDDACVMEPEDFDGHNDDDGCPETSEDRDGDGLIDAVDKCPDVPEDSDGFKDGDGCPDEDDDADGIPDTRDECPRIPEDPDGWEDSDGCPDLDNDGDGVPDPSDRCPFYVGDLAHDGCPAEDADGDGIGDSLDACPSEPETLNGYLDADGCPDTSASRIRVSTSRIELLDKIAFAEGSSELSGSASGVLDDVVAALGAEPTKRVRIEGHTDTRGEEAALLALSLARAEAVRAYLIRAGVGADRLDVEGVGGARPIDTNRTPTGRANNQRIEIVFVD